MYKYSSEPVVPGLVELATPTQFLSSNEPQESSGPIEINYAVPGGTQRLTIDIWDRFGKYVRKLLDEHAPRPGRHTLIWNLEDDSGRMVAPGAFIYRITLDDEAESRVVIIKP